jgi:hypothetical protein
MAGINLIRRCTSCSQEGCAVTAVPDGGSFDCRCIPTGVNQFILEIGDAKEVLLQCPTCLKVYRFKTGAKVTHKCGTPFCHTPYRLAYSSLLSQADLMPGAGARSRKDSPWRGEFISPSYIGADAFSGKGRIRVAWVQDYAGFGGSELSNCTCVDVGKALGFDIVGVTPVYFHAPVIESADVVVINNFWTFKPEQVRYLANALWGRRIPYIKYEHDYREIERRDRWEAWRLFHRAARVVCISPQHAEDYKKALGREDIITLPLAIDVGVFNPVAGVERRKGVWLNTSGKFFDKHDREYLAFLAEREGERFEVVAGVNGVGLPQNCDPRISPIPAMPQEKLPVLYSSVDGLFHLPDKCRWAGERIVFEAALCGVERFKLNANVGHASWGVERLADPDGLREWLRQAVFDFWQVVEEVARGR